MKSALLLSGGIDSVALAFWKKPALAVTIDYGQLPFEGELRAAQAVADSLQIPHEIIRVDCSSLGAGDLCDGPQLEASPVSEWWPYRNQLLITLAVMKVIRFGIDELMIGTVATDNVHADGQQQFVNLISQLVSFQEGGLIVSAPALKLDSTELVRLSGIPPNLLFHAHSCHKSSVACGECRGCHKYRAVMHSLFHSQGLYY